MDENHIVCADIRALGQEHNSQSRVLVFMISSFVSESVRHTCHIWSRRLGPTEAKEIPLYDR